MCGEFMCAVSLEALGQSRAHCPKPDVLWLSLNVHCYGWGYFVAYFFDLFGPVLVLRLVALFVF